MRYEDIEKLLGGYAHGNLSEAERKALFEAALTHQELFDQLADEEALRELLSDPHCRRQLLALLGGERQPAWQRALAWLGQPRALALAGSLAALVLVASIAVQVQFRKAAAPETQIAAVRPAPQQAEPAPLAVEQEAAKPAAPPRREKARAQAPEARRLTMPENRPAAPVMTAPPVPAEKAEQAAVAAAPPRPSSDVAGPPAERPAMLAERAPAPPDARALYDSSVRPAPLGFAGGAVRAKAASARLASAEGAPLGVRCTILRDGVEASPAETFGRGEKLELGIETNQPGYVSVLGEQAAGPWAVHGLRTETGNRILIRLPARGKPGPAKLLIVFSPQRLLPTEADALAKQEPGRRNLRTVEQKAVYAVDPNPGPAGRLQVEVTLQYR